MTIYQRTEHAPNDAWMTFTATHLPDARNYWITDVDTVIRDRSGNLMLLELKFCNADVSMQQQSTLFLLDALIKEALRHNGGKVSVPGLEWPVKVNYHGVHLLQVDGTDFEGCQLYWDREPISRDQLIEKLSFFG